MDSSTLGVPRNAPDGYYLKNVRYVQYFLGDGIALHANYWMPDSVFGTTNTSHGCVGMREADAKFFWDFADIGTSVVVHYSDKKVVSAVVGQTVDNAKAILGTAGFDVQVSEQYSDQVATGTVISQQPDGGTATDARGVTLVVSKGPQPKPTPTPKPTLRTVRPPQNGLSWVPDVVGLPEANARKIIEQAGLSNTYINYQMESDVAADSRPFFRSVPVGSVVSTTPGVGTELPTGSVVKLAVRRDNVPASGEIRAGPKQAPRGQYGQGPIQFR